MRDAFMLPLSPIRWPVLASSSYHGRLAILFSAIAWANWAEIKDGATALVAAAVTIATGWVVVSQKIGDRRRQRRRDDFEESIREQKERDEADKVSLSRQLEAYKADQERMRVESANNQEHMRQSLHDIKDELSVALADGRDKQRSLQAANEAASRATADLVTVALKNSSLLDEVTRLRGELADHRAAASQAPRDVLIVNPGAVPVSVVPPEPEPEPEPNPKA